ncbi:hypothetical protein LTR92_008185 [Exophiala xenobiotica]|nr:hypothetical protein LTR92_008185 [Exophiala xenobiotica]KAK5404056.1 hypothetical protein LTR06_009989 [Exophiala xenobiotica]
MAPTDFSSQSYWENRFTATQTPFEWLLPLDDTTRIVAKLINDHSANRAGVSDPPPHGPYILHIGCGTSELSICLRDWVCCPSHVHNVDYSEEAVKIGRRREEALFASRDADQRRMRWSTADLLSLPDVHSLTGEDGTLFDFVLDKSTSDAIACGDNIAVPSTWAGGGDDGPSPVSLPPVEVLALHLAAITAAGGRWIAISYSGDRFGFLERDTHAEIETAGNDDISTAVVSHPVDGQVVGPATFWRLDKKEQLAIPESEVSTGRNKSTHTVHRPSIGHWLYVLTRTKASLATEPTEPTSHRLPGGSIQSDRDVSANSSRQTDLGFEVKLYWVH